VTGASHDRVYEEYRREDGEFADTLAIDTKTQIYLTNLFTPENLKNGTVHSVILTGNAGDGKTRLCRLVWEQLKPETWSVNYNDTDINLLTECNTIVRVIKDLSDHSLDQGVKFLQQLHQGRDEQGNRLVFLIAANEGRLRQAVKESNIEELRQQVEQQLEGNYTDDNAYSGSKVIIVNLNRVSTSQHVSLLLKKMTAPTLWETCNSCPIQKECPINWNRVRLAQHHVNERIQALYQIVEQLGYHITFRDMLIHLSYTLIGRLSCTLMQNLTNDQLILLYRWSYYRNCFGEEEGRDFQRKGVIGTLRLFDLALISNFEIDEVIIKGDRDQDTWIAQNYNQLFQTGLDLGGTLFKEPNHCTEHKSYGKDGKIEKEPERGS
jgi:hypothetical protein